MLTFFVKSHRVQFERTLIRRAKISNSLTRSTQFFSPGKESPAKRAWKTEHWTRQEVKQYEYDRKLEKNPPKANRNADGRKKANNHHDDDFEGVEKKSGCAVM